MAGKKIATVYATLQTQDGAVQIVARGQGSSWPIAVYRAMQQLQRQTKRGLRWTVMQAQVSIFTITKPSQTAEQPGQAQSQQPQ